MLPTSFMLVAGDPSGDLLAAELTEQLRAAWWRRFEASAGDRPPLADASGPQFFGAGGEAMRAAGVEIVEDMTHRAIIGLAGVLRRFPELARLLERVRRLAVRRQPAAVITVDYGAFNLRLQARLRRLLAGQSRFNNWRPRLVQFVSPQVWATRPGRARQMERDLDLLISILPFERDWFASRAPGLKVASVGHPLVSRHAGAVRSGEPAPDERPLVALLPGSRPDELRRHLPVLLAAVAIMQHAVPCRFVLVAPNERLAMLARAAIGSAPVELHVGDAGPVLAGATLALSKTGTITLELALHGVPAVTFYRTNWLTYAPARLIVNVPWLSMPNLLGGEPLYPEYVQHAATGEALAGSALELLRDAGRRNAVRQRLAEVVAQLGGPGATYRAATAIFELFDHRAP